MVSDDCSTRINRKIKDKMATLDFVKKETTYSEIADKLVNFYEEHKRCKNGRKR